MKRKLVLFAATFMLAIGGAFASAALTDIPGHIDRDDVPNLPSQCEFYEDCQVEGTVPCTVTFEFENVLYVDYQLKEKEGIECTELLNRIP